MRGASDACQTYHLGSICRGGGSLSLILVPSVSDCMGFNVVGQREDDVGGRTLILWLLSRKGVVSEEAWTEMNKIGLKPQPLRAQRALYSP